MAKENKSPVSKKVEDIKPEDIETDAPLFVDGLGLDSIDALELGLAIKKKYGKNAILKGMDLEEGATARDRNGQIGGHKA